MKTNLEFMRDPDRGPNRRKLCAAWAAGLPEEEIAEYLNLSPSYVQEDIAFLKRTKILLENGGLDPDVKDLIETTKGA